MTSTTARQEIPWTRISMGISVLVALYYGLGINHMILQNAGAPALPGDAPQQPIPGGEAPARPPFAGDDDYIPGEQPPKEAPQGPTYH